MFRALLRVAGLAALILALPGGAAGQIISLRTVPVEELAATVVRVGVTCLAHLVLLWSGAGVARTQGGLTLRVLGWVLLSGAIGMGLGMSLILLALRHGEVGMVGILSSVSPVLVLPLLWLYLGRPPARGAWIGAAMTVGGTVLVLSRHTG